jgi:hypothetical protein
MSTEAGETDSQIPNETNEHIPGEYNIAPDYSKLIKDVEYPIGNYFKEILQKKISDATNLFITKLNTYHSWKRYQYKDGTHLMYIRKEKLVDDLLITRMYGLEFTNEEYQIIITGKNYKEPEANSLQFKIIKEYEENLKKNIKILQENIQSINNWKEHNDKLISYNILINGYYIEIKADPIVPHTICECLAKQHNVRYIPKYSSQFSNNYLFIVEKN